MNRLLLFLLGLAIGAIVGWFLARPESVPPPPFTRGSFSNSTGATVSTTSPPRLWYWVKGQQVPTAAQRRTEGGTGWSAGTRMPMTTVSPNVSYEWMPSESLQNVVLTAIVVTETISGVEREYINFTPDVGTFGPSLGIGSADGSFIAAGSGRTLRSLVLYGTQNDPTESLYDDTDHQK